MADSIIQKLSERFSKFPGIGPRQAKRFVYHLLQSDQATVNGLVGEIKELKKTIVACQECYRFFCPPRATTSPPRSCEICLNQSREKTVLLLVEKDIDLDNIEKSGIYRGYYFVIGGLIPILEPKPTSRFHSRELLKCIGQRGKNGLREIIVALSVNAEGDYTIEFLKKNLSPLLQQYSLRFSILGRGLSTGTELEYSDSETLKNALKNRG